MTNDTEIIKVETDYRLGIIPARTPHDVIVQAAEVAIELAKIVKEKRMSQNLQGKEYVKVEGWTTMGAMLGVLPREVTELTRRFEDGSYEATVELIRITDGAVIGRASALVGMDEKDRRGKLTWGSRAEFARRSMAITRATGKAYRLGFSWIMGLAGYMPTPAEEMETVEGEYEESEPIPVAPRSLMTIEMAASMKNREGVAYGDLDSEKLSYMATELQKKIKANGLSLEKREEAQMKLDACLTILQDRAGKE